MLRYATLRYATLRYATLRYATLRYATLRYAMLCYAMLCYAMLCYAMLCYAMLCYARRLPRARAAGACGAPHAARARWRAPAASRPEQRPRLQRAAERERALLASAIAMI